MFTSQLYTYYLYRIYYYMLSLKIKNVLLFFVHKIFSYCILKIETKIAEREKVVNNKVSVLPI